MYALMYAVMHALYLVSSTGGKLMQDSFTVAVFNGDGIGPEIVAALTYGFTYIWVKLVMLYTTMASLV